MPSEKCERGMSGIVILCCVGAKHARRQNMLVLNKGCRGRKVGVEGDMSLWVMAKTDTGPFAYFWYLDWIGSDRTEPKRCELTTVTQVNV